MWFDCKWDNCPQETKMTQTQTLIHFVTIGHRSALNNEQNPYLIGSHKRPRYDNVNQFKRENYHYCISITSISVIHVAQTKNVKVFTVTLFSSPTIFVTVFDSNHYCNNTFDHIVSTEKKSLPTLFFSACNNQHFCLA